MYNPYRYLGPALSDPANWEAPLAEGYVRKLAIDTYLWHSFVGLESKLSVFLLAMTEGGADKCFVDIAADVVRLSCWDTKCLNALACEMGRITNRTLHFGFMDTEDAAVAAGYSFYELVASNYGQEFYPHSGVSRRMLERAVEETVDYLWRDFIKRHPESVTPPASTSRLDLSASTI